MIAQFELVRENKLLKTNLSIETAIVGNSSPPTTCLMVAKNLASSFSSSSSCAT